MDSLPSYIYQEYQELTINKQQLYNQKEKFNNNNSKSKQSSEKQDKLPVSTNFKIIDSQDMTSQRTSDNGEVILQHNDEKISNCIQSQKIEQKNTTTELQQNIITVSTNYKMINQGDITNLRTSDNGDVMLQFNEKKTQNCIQQQKIEQENTNCEEDENIKKIFDSKGTKQQIYSQLLKKNYILEHHIKSGGEGDVFKGYFTNEQGIKQQDCAFKIYRIKMIFDENQFIDEIKLNDEINLMKQFGQHKNIIKTFDTLKILTMHIKNKQEIKVEQYNILVMELCKFSLSDELNNLRQGKQFSFDHLLKILFDLLDALIKLRMHKILHSDIKPGNILKKQDDSYCISDFGISQKKQNIDMKFEYLGGTPNYEPQEQNDNSNMMGYKTDIYSLGIVFTKIIDIFEQVNQNIPKQQVIIINNFKEIIKKQMLEKDINQRKQAKKIHKQFFQQINNPEFIIFNAKYAIQLYQQYQDERSSLLMHQDFFYQMDQFHYYGKILLPIIKMTPFFWHFVDPIEYAISSYYQHKLDFYLNLKEFLAVLDVVDDWLIDIAQKVISNIFKMKEENEYNIESYEKGKEKLKQCYEKLKSLQKKQYEQYHKLAFTSLYLAKFNYNDKNIDEANRYLEESHEFEKKIQNNYTCNLSQLQKEYGNYYTLAQKFEKAKKYTEESLKMFQKQQQKYVFIDVIESSLILANIYSKTKNFKMAQISFFRAIQYEKMFLEDNHLYYQFFLFYLGCSIYMQNREQVTIKKFDVNGDIFECLKIKQNELKNRKESKKEETEQLPIEQKLQNSINDSFLDDEQKKTVYKYIKEFIGLKN